MTHAAIQVRDAVVAALAGATSAGGNVGLLRKHPRGEDELPYVGVSLGSEEPRQLGTGPNATILADDEIVLTYLVKEKGDVEAVAFQLDLEARKRLADNRLAGLLQRIVPGPRQIGEEQLDVPCYQLQRIFRVQYQTRVTTPDTTL